MLVVVTAEAVAESPAIQQRIPAAAGAGSGGREGGRRWVRCGAPRASSPAQCAGQMRLALPLQILLAT
jgi:hypothetical protein